LRTNAQVAKTNMPTSMIHKHQTCHCMEEMYGVYKLLELFDDDSLGKKKKH
jgi:hypothetical protein